jgi:predicted dehydrogenase
MILKTVRWGIIGCGDVTENKSGPAFNKIKGSELVAVMRRDKSKARDYAVRHHVSKWYSKADELIHDPDVNAVYIVSG